MSIANSSQLGLIYLGQAQLGIVEPNSGGAVTGTAAFSANAATLSATGAVALIGTATLVAVAATLAATGSVALTGTAAFNASPAVLAATGTVASATSNTGRLLLLGIG